jgi:hypothetical protein
MIFFFVSFLFIYSNFAAAATFFDYSESNLNSLIGQKKPCSEFGQLVIRGGTAFSDSAMCSGFNWTFQTLSGSSYFSDSYRWDWSLSLRCPI